MAACRLASRRRWSHQRMVAYGKQQHPFYSVFNEHGRIYHSPVLQGCTQYIPCHYIVCIHDLGAERSYTHHARLANRRTRERLLCYGCVQAVCSLTAHVQGTELLDLLVPMTHLQRRWQASHSQPFSKRGPTRLQPCRLPSQFYTRCHSRVAQ